MTDRTRVADLPETERPAYKVTNGANDCSLSDLLATVVGGKDPLGAAFEILRTHAGDLRSVSAAELASLPGVGETGAARIIAARELGKRLNGQGPAVRIHGPHEAAETLLPLVSWIEQERFYVLLLNSRNDLIGEPVMVYQGTGNSASIVVGEAYKEAVRRGATAVIFAHNHPSGDPSPSPEDVAITRALVQGGQILGIDCLDHVIIGSTGQWVSLKSKGLWPS